MLRISIIIISILATALLTAQTNNSKIIEHHFNFKGFATTIEDDAMDENGNHLLVGQIEVLEDEEEMRDTSINRIFMLKNLSVDREFGIIIVTDSNYTILKIKHSFKGRKVIYDKPSKQFFIGANFLDFIKVEGKSFSAWQPLIIKTNLELNSKFYFLERNYSCFLQNIQLETDRILLFTQSSNNERFEKRKEKVEIFAVSTEKVNRSTSEYVSIFRPLLTAETSFESGRAMITNISKQNESYYFGVSTLNQTTLTNSIHLYQFKNNALKEIAFPEFLQYALSYDNWIYLNNFYVDSNSNCYLLSHKASFKKEITFIKTDTNFLDLTMMNIPLNNYADNNDFLILKNGNIVVLSINESGNWSYYIYSDKMEFLKELKTDLSPKYRPMRIKESGKNQLTCIFTINIKTKQDCIVQRVDHH